MNFSKFWIDECEDCPPDTIRFIKDGKIVHEIRNIGMPQDPLLTRISWEQYIKIHEFKPGHIYIVLFDPAVLGVGDITKFGKDIPLEYPDVEIIFVPVQGKVEEATITLEQVEFIKQWLREVESRLQKES